MTLGSGSGEDMREDLPGRRSASPAKRSAAAMEGEEVEMVSGTTTENETAVIDERIKKVWELSNTSVEEGEEGYVISQAWLKRVQARSSEGKGKAEESDTEGSIGPVDNSGIVPEGAFTGPHLKFEKGDVDFVPLKPQLERSADYEVLPKAAWDLIVEWYGVADGQSPIVRFAKDTAPPESTATNIQYEIYPPVFTVRKMLSASDKTARPPSPPGTNNHSQANTVQTTPEREAQAVKLVASRQDRYQSFLARCKRAAGVPMEHKVRPWRQVNTAQVVVNPSTASRPGILTPAASRTNSPGPESTTQSTSSSLPSLLVERAEFDKFEEGTSIEIVDMKDETGNPNYNGGGKITLDVVGLIEDQTLILEEQVRGPAGGEFISDTKRAKKKTEEAKSSSAQDSDASTSGPVTRGRAKKSGKSRGTVGLQNLGNTCYMNSALQCISRIEELAWYFLSSKWKQEINGDNPLGYNGNMARAYADFLSGLHKEGAMATFTPRQFKNALAAAQPMFSGYGQQDSQEFLSFLVDALHEDLNRIHKKPYLENPDSDDSRVHDPAYITELGEKYRENHRARNNSIAMDLFSGFYKNRMDCPECKKVSVTFDPYSLLTLQLPIETTWQHKVIYIPHKGQPSQRMVDVDKSASIRNFKQRFAEKVGARPENLFVAEFFSQRLYKVWKDTEQVSEISQNDQIAVFEFDNAPTNITKTKSMQYRSFSSPRQDDIPDMDSPLADHMAVTVVNRTNNKSHWGPTYQPLIVMISRDEAKEYDLILKKILAQLAKYTSRNFLSEDAALPTQTSMSRKSSDSGLTSNTESPEPVDAKLSDRSVPSEDEYVNVSMRDGSSPATATDDLPEVLRPGAAIPAGLRSLFKVGYYSSPTGDMNCTGNSATIDAAPMLERVNYNTSRRSSVTSITSAQSNQSGSTEHSTTSATSQTLSATADDDSSEVLPLTNGRDTERWAGDPQSDAEDEMNFMQPSDMVENTFKAANRRKHDIKNKNRRGNRRIQRTYAKRDKARPAKKADPVRSFPPRSPSGPNAANDPYFIKLGEGIVLDWSEEGWDALFGGDIRSPDERGYGTIDDKVLTITEDPELDAKLEKRRRRKKEGVSLEDCFAETARTETLSEENAWYCNRCKELRRADKTLEIWTAPDILVLHLKRFSGERYRRDKVDVLVDFPLEGLDLSSRVGLQEDGKGYLYDLFAVDNHYGGLGGGHYTAYARNFWDGKWYDFNDSFVSQTNPASVVTPAAYLLFYRRRSDRPLGPRYLQDLVIEARNAADAEEETPDSFAGPGRTLSAAETKKEGSNASARLLLPGPARAEAVYDSAPKDGVPIGTCDGRAMQGPVRPPALGEGAGWNFDGLDGAADAREREGEGSDPDSMKIELPEEEEEGDGDGREWLLGQPTDDEEGEGEVRMSVE